MEGFGFEEGLSRFEMFFSEGEERGTSYEERLSRFKVFPSFHGRLTKEKDYG